MLGQQQSALHECSRRKSSENWITICSKSTSRPSSAMNNLLDLFFAFFHSATRSVLVVSAWNLHVKGNWKSIGWIDTPRKLATRQRITDHRLQSVADTEHTSSLEMEKQQQQQPWDLNLNLNSFSCHTNRRLRWKRIAHNYTRRSAVAFYRSDVERCV